MADKENILAGGAPDTADTKRQRMSDALPELGSDASEFLPERGLLLRHGTSLQLMSQVSEVMNSSNEFGEIDPSADWQKWSERRPQFSLYYAALVDPARDGADAYQAVLRAVLDGFPEPAPPHRQRLIIDYVTTRQAARGKGLAGVLIKFVLQCSRLFGANTYVLATEDSCPFWVEKGFLLEQGKPLNARLNIFNDTHLLRLSSDGADAGAEEDLQLAVEEEEEEEGDGEEEEDGEEGDDAALQAALALSMAPAAPAPAPAPAAGASQEALAVRVRELFLELSASGLEPNVAAAQALQRAQQELAAAPTAPPQAAAAEGGGGEDEDEELQAALALSLAPP